ncbi:hypothetical protein N0V90_011605 [Kalmusia sp. IMI 367209]|nr:hypothetical protein N0V90_011605 [Kalmusia sp. IMI 367209]
MATGTPPAPSHPASLADTVTASERAVYDQFILFGDSITQIDGNPELGFSCYQALQHDYIRRVDIINRGFSGYNTQNALLILPKIIPPPQQTRVRLVNLKWYYGKTLFFGANDASLPNTTGQHIPLERYKAGLHALLDHSSIRAHEEIKVLLITPPPIDEWQFDTWVRCRLNAI